MHVYEALAQQARTAVGTIFGVIGEGNLYLVDAFRKLDGARYVAAAHEAGAVLMASGFAQAGGGVGMATVTHGPGLTNTITALVDARRTGVPIVLVAGAVPEHDPGNVQAIDEEAVLAGTGVAIVRAGSAADSVPRLAEAITRALQESRPVVFLLPADLLWAEVASDSALEPWPDRGSDSRPVSGPGQGLTDEPDLDAALGILAAARRPILLAGAGVLSEAGREALVELARVRGARLATTLRAKDLFRDVPGDVGICGNFALPVGAEAIGRSDCVVAFGASLNQYTTMDGTLLDGKRVVQVDVEPTAIGRHRPVDAGVVGDAVLVARTMAAQLVAAGVASSGYDETDLGAAATAPWAPPAGPGQLDTVTVATQIDRMLPTNRALAPDAGRFLHLVYRVFGNPTPHGYVHGIGFGAIGIGLAQAVGAWCACPDRPVLHVSGDGGFMLGGLAELHTAVRERADLVVVVFNDGSYGAEHIQLRRREHDVEVSMMAWPALAAVAAGLGVPSITVRTQDDLPAVRRLIDGRTGPVLVEVLVDPDQLNGFVP